MKYLVTRKPASSLSLLNDFDRIFNDFWTDFPTASTANMPRVDIRDNGEGKYILEAELPGLTEKDVKVSIEKHILTISSVKEEDKNEKLDGYVIRERRHTSFQRSFVLPEGVDETAVQAEFKHGVLTLEIPRLPEAQPKKIEVKIAS